jgi:hypothetical protein
VNDHEDVLRQTLRFYREHAPANCKEANAIDAVLAEVESLRAERDDLRVEIVEAKESLRKAGSIGAGYLTRVERLEAALRNIAVRIGRLDPTLEQTPLHYTITCIVREEREALAPSAPEPAPAEPWVQCTDHMNLAKPRCLGGCRTRAEHERYTAKPEPAPAPTERVCRCGHERWPLCDSFAPSREVGERCSRPRCGHDRACHTGERR